MKDAFQLALRINLLWNLISVCECKYLYFYYYLLHFIFEKITQIMLLSLFYIIKYISCVYNDSQLVTITSNKI